MKKLHKEELHDFLPSKKTLFSLSNLKSWMGGTSETYVKEEKVSASNCAFTLKMEAASTFKYIGQNMYFLFYFLRLLTLLG
jgi:hypothetical protein